MNKLKNMQVEYGFTYGNDFVFNLLLFCTYFFFASAASMMITFENSKMFFFVSLSMSLVIALFLTKSTADPLGFLLERKEKWLKEKFSLSDDDLEYVISSNALVLNFLCLCFWSFLWLSMFASWSGWMIIPSAIVSIFAILMALMLIATLAGDKSNLENVKG